MDELSIIQHNIAEEVSSQFIDEIIKLEKELNRYKDLVDELRISVYGNNLKEAKLSLMKYGIEIEEDKSSQEEVSWRGFND